MTTLLASLFLVAALATVLTLTRRCHRLDAALAVAVEAERRASLAQGATQAELAREAERRRAVVMHEEEILARARRHSAVAMLAQRALAGARGCALAGRAVELVRRTLPQVSSCELLEPCADGRTLRVRASDVETRRGRRQRVDPRSFLGRALQSPWPSLTPDIQRDDRFAPPEVVDPDARAAVAVAIPGDGTPAGVLCAMSGASHAFAEEDGQFLQAVALVLATARAREAEALAHAPADVLASLTEAAAHGLHVVRASVWFFDPGRTKVVCADLFSREASAHEHGSELFAHAFPAYFRAIEAERTLAAADAHTDPRTAEFSASYLAPLGIGAMLDVPIWVDGVMVGVLCHEHVGGPRTWTPEEEELAYTMGSLVARAEERRRKAKHKAA